MLSGDYHYILFLASSGRLFGNDDKRDLGVSQTRSNDLRFPVKIIIFCSFLKLFEGFDKSRVAIGRIGRDGDVIMVKLKLEGYFESIIWCASDLSKIGFVVADSA